jgi:peptidoglycan hydrolase-like protein with peptidoglycan-binding domain
VPKLLVVLLIVLGLSVAAEPSGAATGGAESASAASTKPVVFKRGSRGATVRAIQRKLGLRADGVYGPATTRAVKRFQRKHGFKADGIVGPVTLARMGLARLARATPLRLLERIALCESGGNPKAVSANGKYRGKYQFSRATWRSLGGKGDPAKAPEAEQDRLAKKLYSQAGTAPWPSCARKARAA